MSSRKNGKKDRFPALSTHTRDMAHLAAGASFGFAVEVHMRAGFGDEGKPIMCLIADEVLHRHLPAGPGCRAQRPARNGAYMLLELRTFGALDRPMPGIVHARGNLVDDEPLALLIPQQEEFDRKNADGFETLADFSGNLGRRRFNVR